MGHVISKKQSMKHSLTPNTPHHEAFPDSAADTAAVTSNPAATASSSAPASAPACAPAVLLVEVVVGVEVWWRGVLPEGESGVEGRRGLPVC